MPFRRPRWATAPVLARAATLYVSLHAALWFAAAAPAGLPLDDAWIHADHARALAESGDLAVGGTGASSGVTSPLWTALLAAGRAATGDPVVTVRLLALLVLPLLALGMHLLAEACGAGWTGAMLCGTLTALSGPLLWLNASGMESALDAAAFPWAAWAVAKRRPWLGGAVAAAALLVRIEGLVLAAPWAVMLAWEAWRAGRRTSGFGNPEGPRPPTRDSRLATLLPGVLLPGLALLTLFAFDLAVAGRLLPATLQAKRFAHGIGRLPFCEDAWIFVAGWAGYLRHAMGTASGIPGSGWAVAAACAGGLAALVAARRKAAAWLAVCALAVDGAYLAVLPVLGAAGRYQVANWLLPPLLAASGTAWLARRRGVPAKVVAGALAAFLAAGALSAAGAWRAAFAANVRQIQDVHVRAGRTIAAQNPGCLPILVYDVGAIAYFGRSPGCDPELVDLGGLLDASLLPVVQAPRAVQRLALERGGHVLVALPTAPEGNLLCPPDGLVEEGRVPDDRLVDPTGLLALERVIDAPAEPASGYRWLVQANAPRLTVWRASPTAAGQALMRQGPAAVAALSLGEEDHAAW